MRATAARGRSTFPSAPGAPSPLAVESDAIKLEWAAPTTSGGSGIQGYRINMRSSGLGDFLMFIAHTSDPEPCMRVTGLAPMTWYEFRVAAMNATSVGPYGAASEPILTRATEQQKQLIKDGGRRRRTKQTVGGALLAAEQEALQSLVAREAGISADLERSLASMASWEEVFRVRHGRRARDEDRQGSRVLRDEAHTMRVLRHALAEASIATLQAERSLVLKEQAITHIAMKKWERTRTAISGEPATADERASDPRHSQLAARSEEAVARLRRIDRRHRRAAAQLEAAWVELGEAAADPTADAAVVEAAAAVARTGGAAPAEGEGGGAAVQRRWTQDLRTGVASRNKQYASLVLARAMSREHVDAIGGLSEAQLRRSVLLFGYADRDGDGCLDMEEASHMTTKATRITHPPPTMWLPSVLAPSILVPCSFATTSSSGLGRRWSRTSSSAPSSKSRTLTITRSST